MSDPYLGEIRMFAGTYAPVDWAFCNGQMLSVSEYQALFALIGTTYGGNGTTNFGVPDLRGRLPMHDGQGTGLTPRTLAQSSGTETVTLTENQMPAHTHNLMGTSANATASSPANALLASASEVYASGTPALLPLANSTVVPTGGSQSHDNVMPFLCVNFIICLQGFFPQRG
ncbi:MAG: phage tail protein [Candidatus Wallbacteria bacterium]|nr:phage tail protein [Candidatus Wallbacteria bacterium]